MDMRFPGVVHGSTNSLNQMMAESPGNTVPIHKTKRPTNIQIAASTTPPKSMKELLGIKDGGSAPAEDAQQKQREKSE